MIGADSVVRSYQGYTYIAVPRKIQGNALQLQLTRGAFIGGFVVLKFAGGEFHSLQELPFEQLWQRACPFGLPQRGHSLRVPAGGRREACLQDPVFRPVFLRRRGNRAKFCLCGDGFPAFKLIAGPCQMVSGAGALCGLGLPVVRESRFLLPQTRVLRAPG